MRKFSTWRLLFFPLLLTVSVINAQNIGINTSGAAANTSAILDLNTGNTYTSPNGKGLLIPNVALTGVNDAATIVSPATSLLVYVPAASGLAPAGYYYNSGTPAAPVWTSFSGGMGGAGTLNYLARWTPNGSTLGIGVTQDNGSVAVIQQTVAVFGTTTELTVNANATETNAILGATTIANGVGVTGSNTQITGTSAGVAGSVGTYSAPAWGAVGVYGSANNNTTYGVEGNNPSGDPTGGAGVIGYDYSGTGVIGSNDLITQVGFYHGPHGTGGNFFSAYNGLTASYNMTGAGGSGALAMGYNSGGPINPNASYNYDFGLVADFGGNAGGAGFGAAVGGFIGNTAVPSYRAGVLGASNATDYGVLGYNTLAGGYALAGINSIGITGNGLYVSGVSYLNGFTGIETAAPARALEISGLANTARIDGLITGGTYNNILATKSDLVYADDANGDLHALPAPNAISTLVSSAIGVLSWQNGVVPTGSGTPNYYARWTPSGTQLGIGFTEDNGTSISMSNPASAPVNNTMLTVTGNATSVNAIVGITAFASGSGVFGIGSGANSAGVTGSAGAAGIGEVGVYADNTSTGAGTEYGLEALKSGATVTGTGYAVYGAATGTATTNYGGYFSASGGTNNYGLVVPSTGGNSGFGTITPTTLLQIGNAGTTTGKLSVYSQDAFHGQVQIGNPANNSEASIDFISGVTSFGAPPASTNGNGNIWNVGAGSYGAGGTKFNISNVGINRPVITLTSTGFMGIATVNPNRELEVFGTANTVRIGGLTTAGTFYSTNTASTAATSLMYSDNTTGDVGDLAPGTTGFVLTQTATGPKWQATTVNTCAGTTNQIPLYTNANTFCNSIINQNNANTMIGIGIAANAEQENLSIQNGLNIDQANTDNGTLGGNPDQQLTFGSGSGEGIGSQRTGGAKQFGLDFYTGYTERMTVLNNGFVGIGTTAPAGQLHVNNADYSGNNPVIIQGSANATWVGADLRFEMAGGGAHTYDIIGSSGTGASIGAGAFGIWDATANIYRFDIMPNGNVGIGTVAPTRAVLEQAGAVGNTTALFGTGNSGIGLIANWPAIYFNGYWNGGPKSMVAGFGGSFWLDPADGHFEWRTTSNVFGNDVAYVETTRMTLLNNGNVGIGTTAPVDKLDVNGTAGKPGGGAWIAFSDKRLKQQIKPYNDGLAQLLKINPITYHYNELSGYDTKPQYVGVLAQELKPVAPYMVGIFTKDSVEYYNVDNSAMTYMIINAVKEQQQIILGNQAANTSQQAEIDELKKQNEELKKQLSDLTNTVNQILSKQK